jgi:hypothetical protein
MSEPLELELARFEVEQYENIADEDVIVHESRQAQDSMDCEEFLNRGIQSYTSIECGERTLYRAHSAGLIDVTPELEQEIETIRRRWLRPCGFAESWIATCHKNGYQIRNLEEFRQCCRRANEWFDRAAEFHRAKAIRDEALDQEPW